MIPYGRQSVDNDDIDAVVSVLRSDFLTQGPSVPRFEEAIGTYCGVQHVTAVNSATSALHIACLALGVTDGDLVWTSPISFVASANCARYCGAQIDFVDIDSRTYNMSVDALSKKLEVAKRSGRLPKVVIPVHFAGQPCDMAEIRQLSREYGFFVIEDASHAIGARYRDTTIGDCEYSDISVFSFHPVKIITTAEGGAATTRSALFHRRMQLLRSHGITRESHELANKNEGAWYYEQQMLGFNYRMTDIQAALGTSQLKKIDIWIDRRHAIANRYREELAHLPITLPTSVDRSKSAFHLFPILVENRRKVFDRLRATGIGVNVHYIPIYRQPDFRRCGFDHSSGNEFPSSESYYSRTISLPMFATLSDDDQTNVIHTLRQILQ